MANIFVYALDVFASNAKEIHNIAKALREPSKAFFASAGAATRIPADEEIGRLRQVVAFHPVRNLEYVQESVNEARRFGNSFSGRAGLILRHLSQVSELFPSVIFLLDYTDTQTGYACKEVTRNGAVEKSFCGWDQEAQGCDWILLDIFAPFWAEHQNGQPFGSLWNQWVKDLVAAALELTP